MHEKHISTYALELLIVGSNHELTDRGREVLVNWTKNLLESGFGISLPDSSVIKITSKLKVLSVNGYDAMITWTVKISGDTGQLKALDWSHFSSEPREIGDGVFEIDMITEDSMYGSENAVLNLIKS